jgi:hypothetical protein
MIRHALALAFKSGRLYAPSVIVSDKTSRFANFGLGAIAIVVLLGIFPNVASAQSCETVPGGPARTDCFIGLSRIYHGQSDVAASKARVQSDRARYRQIAETGGPKHKPHHRH